MNIQRVYNEISFHRLFSVVHSWAALTYFILLEYIRQLAAVTDMTRKTKQ